MTGRLGNDSPTPRRSRGGTSDTDEENIQMKVAGTEQYMDDDDTGLPSEIQAYLKSLDREFSIAELRPEVYRELCESNGRATIQAWMAKRLDKQPRALSDNRVLPRVANHGFLAAVPKIDAPAEPVWRINRPATDWLAANIGGFEEALRSPSAPPEETWTILAYAAHKLGRTAEEQAAESPGYVDIVDSRAYPFIDTIGRYAVFGQPDFTFGTFGRPASTDISEAKRDSYYSYDIKGSFTPAWWEYREDIEDAATKLEHALKITLIEELAFAHFTLIDDFSVIDVMTALMELVSDGIEYGALVQEAEDDDSEETIQFRGLQLPAVPPAVDEFVKTTDRGLVLDVSPHDDGIELMAKLRVYTNEFS